MQKHLSSLSLLIHLYILVTQNFQLILSETFFVSSFLSTILVLITQLFHVGFVSYINRYMDGYIKFLLFISG